MRPPPKKPSFRNLLSLLKRPNKSDTFPAIAAKHIHRDAPSNDLPLLPMPLDDAMRPVLSRSQTQAGSLTYLVDGEGWTACSITLQANNISVSWGTETKEISLLGCSDIRSVSSPETDLKVFELLFKDPAGTRTERFAVSTVRERAKWISAFWDAILPSSTSQQLESKRQLDRMQEEDGSPQKLSLTRTPTDRSLPPLPLSSRSKSRTLPSTPKPPAPTPIAPLNVRSRSRVSFDDTPPPSSTRRPTGLAVDTSYASMSRTSTTGLPIPPPISPVSAYSSASAPRSRFSYTESPIPVPPSRVSSPSPMPKGKGKEKKWPPPVSRWSSHSQSRLPSSGERDTTGDQEHDPPKRISMFTKVPLDEDGVPSHIRLETLSRVPSTSGTHTGILLRRSHTTAHTTASSGRSPREERSNQGQGRAVEGTRAEGEGIKRANSASISNLSRLSVVKTRLAAMEGAASASAPTSPASTRSFNTSTRSYHISSKLNGTQQASSRVGSLTSADPNSTRPPLSAHPNVYPSREPRELGPGLTRVDGGGDPIPIATTLKKGTGSTRADMGRLERGLDHERGEDLAQALPQSEPQGERVQGEEDLGVALVVPRGGGGLTGTGAADYGEMGAREGDHRDQPRGRVDSSVGMPGSRSGGARGESTSDGRGVRGRVIDATSGTGTGTATTTTDGLPGGDGSAAATTTPGNAYRVAEVVSGIQAMRRTLGSPRGGEDDVYTVMRGLGEKVDGVREVVEGMEKVFYASHSSSSLSKGGETQQSEKKAEMILEGMRREMKTGLENIQAKIEEIVQLHRNVESSGAALLSAGSAAGGVNMEEVKEIRERVDALVKASGETQRAVADAKVGMARDSKNVLAEIAHLTSLLDADHAHREQQSAQQADSVRYLNELNTWLEAFVNNGSSHIQALASSIDKLYLELAPPSGASGSRSGAAPGQSLLHDVRQLVLGMKARDQSMAGLQAAVNDLVVSAGTEVKQSGGLDATALAHVIDAQRREQEAMLRVFTDEISGEIKGERLRFVEAMKEATAINVQHHVEELKKEMGKEVFVMAQEVERLHRDKQEVEQRIAELMAFYSKQSTLTSAGGTHGRLKSGFESTGSHTHAIGQAPPGMLALSSEPAYVHSSVEKYFDFEKQGPNGDPSNPAGPGNQGHYLQGPSSSLDSRTQQYNYNYHQRSTSQYQGGGNGTGGVDGAHATSGSHSNYHMMDESTLKPVVDLRMRPLGSSGGGGDGSRSGSGRETAGKSSVRGSGAGGTGSTQMPRQPGSTSRETTRPGSYSKNQRIRATALPRA